LLQKDAVERKGLLASFLDEPTAERGGKARTYFKATAAGIRETREAYATLDVTAFSAFCVKASLWAA